MSPLQAAAASTRARHREIRRRYAWEARRRRGDTEPTDRPNLLTLIRLRDLEAVFHAYYGSKLPDDDAGREDLFIAAHHIAHLCGEIEEHIVAWAQIWAPWLPTSQA